MSTTSIQIPKLAPGQKISSFEEIYTAATSAFTDDAQKRALLPLYVCRSTAEREIARHAAKKATLADAFKEIEELIDGKKSRIDYVNKFCDIKAEDKSPEGLTSLFFTLKSVGEDAEIAGDLILSRFISFMNNGEKIYEDNKTEIKAADSDDKMIAMFKKLQPRFKSQSQVHHPSIKVKEERFQNEAEMLIVDSKQAVYEDTIKDLQTQIEDLRNLVLYSGDESVLQFSKGKAKADRPDCSICGKPGHAEDRCYKRPCEKCQGLGHDKGECPSRSFNYANKSAQTTAKKEANRKA